jgi:hypothetical protein
LEKGEPQVSTEKEITYVLLWLLVLGSIGASVAVIPPEVQFDSTVTIAPYGQFDFDRTMPAGRNVTIAINVMEGAPMESGYIGSFYIMDYYNYTLKMGGSPTYGFLLNQNFFLQLNCAWLIPTSDRYYFVIDNPSPFNMTARVGIHWEFELSLVIPAALAISSVIITFFAIMYGEREWPSLGTIVELRGDLDMIPDVVTSPPQRLHYVVIAEPSGNRCDVCSAHLEENDPVLHCPYCGSTSHREHLLGWVRAKGYCPVCKKPLGELDLKG